MPIVGFATGVHDCVDEFIAKYRWCGNGRPPHSRVSLFKAYILKAMRNYPYTTTLIAAIRESPSIRRLADGSPCPTFLTSRSSRGLSGTSRETISVRRPLPRVSPRTSEARKMPVGPIWQALRVQLEFLVRLTSNSRENNFQFSGEQLPILARNGSISREKRKCFSGEL